MARLGDICDVRDGTHDSPPYVNKGYPLVTSKNIVDGNLDLSVINHITLEDYNKINERSKVDSGDIIMPMIGTIGNPYLVGEFTEFAIKNVALIKFNNEQINNKYIYHFLNSNKFKKYIAETNRGGTQKFLSLKDIRNMEVNIASLDKQLEIVEILDKISGLIYDKKQQIFKLDELVKSRFIELFGDPETNPKGLEMVLLPEIAEYFNGLTYTPDNVSEGGTIVLRSSNIQNSQLDFADTVRVDCSIKERLFVKDNDILMCSRNGSARLVGKVAIIKNLSEPMTFGAFMMIIRSKYYPYLMTYFQMDAFRRQIKTGATTTINQITGNMLNKIILPLPEMAEINEFATFVEQTDKLKFEVKESLEKLETLKKSLMQQYFG